MNMGMVRLFLAGVSCLLAVTAQAIPITGAIGFTGSASYNSTSLATATAFTGFNAAVLGGSQSGSYASVPALTASSWTPFVFTTSSVTPLWTFAIGSTLYSFDATSVTVDYQDALYLNLRGSGVARITGLDDTVGTWSITSVGGTSTFTFGAESVSEGSASVPDGGTSAAMLGLALAGLARFRKRVAS
jgi:hypothetical protein